MVLASHQQISYCAQKVSHDDEISRDDVKVSSDDVIVSRDDVKISGDDIACQKASISYCRDRSPTVTEVRIVLAVDCDKRI